MCPDESGKKGLYLSEKGGWYLYGQGLDKINELGQNAHFNEVASSKPGVETCVPLLF